MKSYLFLTPPQGPKSGSDRDHRSTLVLRDGFSWTALVLPWLWLLWRGAWIAGLIVLAVQIGGVVLAAFAGFGFAGLAIALACALLVALEGRHYHSEMLIRRGWELQDIVSAPDLTTAEAIYFSNLPQPAKSVLPAIGDWAGRAQPPAPGWQNAGIGLFDHGGR